MKYQLKTGNFRDFSKFKENVLVPRSYFIPYKSSELLLKTNTLTERYNSDIVKCLSGEWDFVYYESDSAVPSDFDTESIAFDKVTVPSTWQHTGYEKPYYVNTRYQFTPAPFDIPADCPVGIYRRFIDIFDLSLNYTISFLGVAGSLELFVNGRFAGYSEGSHNTAEFELNDFLVDGKNEIVVQNHKWSNGTYLECQDMFRCNGIFRDVLLYVSENNSIYDFEAKTVYKSGKYSLSLIPSLKLTDDSELTAALYDGDELVVSKSVGVSPTECEKLSFESLDVREWSAEIPYLYRLVITLSKEGEPIEIIRKNIGFKHIEIKENVFYFNNKPIKLLGVNHHDTNPKTGYVMTADDIKKDVSLIKEYNANCVRTSHYPPDPIFLDLCDKYGIYVVDEADIETHGCEIELKKPGACSNNPKWQSHYFDRVLRMFERDKNHPSVTMWSLGNEAHGYKNQDYCYDELKKRTKIPIHYEAVCRTKRWSYDVLSQMYTPQRICEKIAAGRGLPPKYYKKPFYLCEYAHAMGVGAGDLERYVKCFYSADIMLGGCIWEFADHAVYHENGKYKYTYGGDHGELKHDGNFCVDGLFYPDRTPHSGAKQMKACYRPVRAEKSGDAKFCFINHLYFKTTDFTVKYKHLTDGAISDSGEFDISVEPQEKKTVELNVKTDKNKHEVIIFEYFDGEKNIAAEQIVLSEGKLNSKISKDGKLVINHSENKLFVHFKNGYLIFDKSNGFIESYVYKGREMINKTPLSAFKGFSPQLYRAPIDNDMFIAKRWQKIRLDALTNKCKVKSFTENDNCAEIAVRCKSKSAFMKSSVNSEIIYKIYPSGEMSVSLHCLSGNLRLAPRYGLQLEMPGKYDFVKYFGLGSELNLNDFKEHALSGIYETTVDEMREDYIKPQESAVRTDVRFAEIKDSDGFGLRFEAQNRPFTLAVNNYTPQLCAQASHREDLTRMPTTCINIDAAHMGAGSNACGPRPSKNHRVGRLRRKAISFTVKPIGD